MSKNWKWTVCIVWLSSGIGAGFAREFAEQWYNLFLIAKNKDELETFAQYLQILYPINIATTVLDASIVATHKKILTIIASIKDLSFLINCIAYTTDKQPAPPKKIQQLKDIITFHDTSAMRISQETLKIMQNKKKWSIIHVSSLISILGIGKDPIVAMSRIFLWTPIGNLERIKKEDKISLQVLCPNTIDINFWYFQHSPKHRSRSIRHIVKTSIHYQKQWTLVCIPSWKTQLVLGIYNFLPTSRSHKMCKRFAR